MSTQKALWNVTGGATQLTRHEAQRFARDILTSQSYRDQLQLRAKNGNLPPAVETMLWHYAYGKPVENVNLNLSQGEEDLSSLSIAELQAKLQRVQDQLQEAQDLSEAIPGEVVQGPWEDTK